MSPCWAHPIGILAFLLASTSFTSAADSPAVPLLAKIKAVRGGGEGNVEAAKAWQELVRLGPDALFDTLAALDDATPLASNWLRSAVDAIAERGIATGQPPASDKLEAFVRDTHHIGVARWLAFNWLSKTDKAAAGKLLPSMLNDPGQELRRDAVDAGLADARKALDSGDKANARLAFQKLFESARDQDQVDLLAKELEKLGVKTDLAGKFGIIQKWWLLGPLENSNKVGFDQVYPPEKKVDLKAPIVGKSGKELHWLEHTSADAHGLVDLNKALGKNMGAVGYAFAVVESATERPVEIRAGSNNAVKLFLNGKQLYFRDEYHHGSRMDQHIGRGVLKAGRNEVLIKVCQNEQKDTWAQRWDFQLRICDALGTAVPVTVVAEK